MKTKQIFPILLFALLISTPMRSIAQEMAKQDYLEKSRKQKTTGFILLGGGLGFVAIGTIVGLSGFSNDVVSCLGGNCPSNSEEMNIGAFMMIAGAGATLASIPVLISAGNNRKKAYQLSILMEPTLPPQLKGNLPSSYPALGFSIPLN